MSYSLCEKISRFIVTKYAIHFNNEKEIYTIKIFTIILFYDDISFIYNCRVHLPHL